MQFEAGSVATTFDYRDYGAELLKCQRYYQVMTIYTLAKTAQYDSNGWIDILTYPDKRVTPIVTTSVAMSQPGSRITKNRALLTSSSAVDGGTAYIDAETYS